MGGRQVRVRTSNVLLEQRLRLVFAALTETQMLSIRSHYIGQQGRFLSFSIPDDLLIGTSTPAYFTPTEYSWIYNSTPKIEDIPGTQRYNVSIELVTVPPEGANVAGDALTVTIQFVGGVPSITVLGLDLTVTTSIVGGVVADNASLGFNLAVPVSLMSGLADPGDTAGFALRRIVLSLTASTDITTLVVFPLNTVNDSATLQLTVTPVDFL